MQKTTYASANRCGDLPSQDHIDHAAPLARLQPPNVSLCPYFKHTNSKTQDHIDHAAPLARLQPPNVSLC